MIAGEVMKYFREKKRERSKYFLHFFIYFSTNLAINNFFVVARDTKIIECLTISRHFTLCYQLSTLVCLVLFCCGLLHCDTMHLSHVCETMRCKVFYTKQRK